MEPEGAVSLKHGCLPEQPTHRIELLSRSRFAAQMAFPPPKGQLSNCDGQLSAWMRGKTGDCLGAEVDEVPANITVFDEKSRAA
jgi:hypothetical protein